MSQYLYWEIFSNNHLAHDFKLYAAVGGKRHGLRTIEVKARARVRLNEPPRMQVSLDGGSIGEIDVREPFWHIYRFATKAEDGAHRLEVRLVNNPDDAYNQRYLAVDWVRVN